MTEFAKVTEPATVRLERLLPGPIERVWAYLTESEKRSKWFGTGEMDLRVGSKFTLTFNNSKLSPVHEVKPEKYGCGGDNMDIYGHILKCEPPHLLAYTFDEGGDASSEVCFELFEKGKDVLLVIVHSRLPNRGTMLSVAGGWHTHIGILIDTLEGKTPTPFWTTHEALVKEYEKRL